MSLFGNIFSGAASAAQGTGVLPSLATAAAPSSGWVTGQGVFHYGEPLMEGLKPNDVIVRAVENGFLILTFTGTGMPMKVHVVEGDARCLAEKLTTVMVANRLLK